MTEYFLLHQAFDGRRASQTNLDHASTAHCIIFPICVFPITLQLKGLLNRFSPETRPLSRTVVAFAVTAYLQVRLFPFVLSSRLENVIRFYVH